MGLSTRESLDQSDVARPAECRWVLGDFVHVHDPYSSRSVARRLRGVWTEACSGGFSSESVSLDAAGMTDTGLLTTVASLGTHQRAIGGRHVALAGDLAHRSRWALDGMARKAGHARAALFFAALWTITVGEQGIEQTMADATGRSSVMTTALSNSSGRMRPSSSSAMSPRVRAMVGIFCRSGW